MTDKPRPEEAQMPAERPDWQRPPFEPNNQMAVTHGARSDALVRPRAEELAPELLAAHPHLDQRKDGPAVFRYARVLARIERVYAWLEEEGRDAVFADLEAGTVHPVHDRLSRWERQAAADEERLGLSPASRAKLGVERMRGAALLEHLRREYAADGDDDDGGQS